jgi:hypothetical protein
MRLRSAGLLDRATKRTVSLGLGALLLLLSLTFAPMILARPARALAGSNVSVTSQDTNGNVITGYYTVLFDSTGQIIKTGYTPVAFTTTAGVQYGLQADSYLNCIFAQWSDGVTSNPRTVTAATGTLSFVAVYNCGIVTTTTTTVSSTTSTTHSTSSTTTMTSSTTSTTTTSTSVGGTSTLTVGSTVNGGGSISGFYTVLYQNGVVVATGYTPAQFKVNNGQSYVVQVQGYNSYYFQYWVDTGSVNFDRTVTPTGSMSLTAVLCNGPPGTCPDPTPVNGITVYVHRIPASYWAPCFALVCSAGTGPGASMYVVLEDSSGNVIQAGFSDEAGITFTGLTPGVTYYVYPEDCDLCHGSQHNVIFNYWTGGSTVRPLAVTVGASLDAWYSCTNNCA